MLGVLRSRGLPALFPRLHFLQQVQQQSWRESCPIRTFSSTVAPDKPHLLALEEVEKVLADVKANDVKVIPVRGLCGWTDHMVVATGRSTWHVRNIAQALVYKVKQKQKGTKRMLLPSMEGHEGGNWIVIDAGAVVVHALDEKARSYYNLENLWTEEKPPEGSSQDLKKAFVKIRPKNNSKKHIEKRP